MGNERVLACDDEEAIRELVSYNLAKEGFAVVSVSSGEEAIRAARKDKPDVIILDLMLPGISGLDVCRRLKEDPETARIPIIMLTAKTEDRGRGFGARAWRRRLRDETLLAACPRRARAGGAQAPDGRGRAKRRRDSQRAGHIPHPDRHEAFLDGAPLALSVTEFQILEFLAATPEGCSRAPRSSARSKVLPIP
jgi:two-component system phosphate regulon response regulator PhoB